MKNQLINLFNLAKEYKEFLYFIAFVFTGIFVKIYHTMQKGKKIGLNWVLAEAIMSFFVAVSVWAICDQFLHLNKIFTYVICAWGGSMSTIFHKKTEELLESIFDIIKAYLKIKLTKNE